MRRILGLVAAGGLWLGTASTADAQFSLSIGNPYAGGLSIGIPYVGGYGGYYGAPYGGYGYSSVVPGVTYYNSGYSGYVAPGTTSFYSGYYGAGVPAVSTFAYPAYGSYYGYRPVYGYGYGGYRGFGFRRYGGFW
jgi:hypothetical protein